MFEGLHQGRIMCAAVANEHTLLTGGDSTVRLCVSCGTHLHCLQSVTSETHCTILMLGDLGNMTLQWPTIVIID